MATAGGARGSGPERAWAATLPDGGEVVLDGDESSHLVRSRRAQEGDDVVLFDGAGTSCLARLERADPRAAGLRIVGPYPDRSPTLRVRVAVSLPEMGRADRMVQALAELGVAELAPLVSARTPAGRAEQAVRRTPRWAKLAREACKVNGCARALVVGEPIAFAAALADGALLLDPDPAATALLALAPQDATRWILVGPEGGFTPAEMASAAEACATVARIGSTALRIETAAIAAAAILLGGAAAGPTS